MRLLRDSRHKDYKLIFSDLGFTNMVTRKDDDMENTLGMISKVDLHLDYQNLADEEFTVVGAWWIARFG